MTERPIRPPHENLLSSARFTLNRALELLPDPESLSNTELTDLHGMIEDSMSTLTQMGQTVVDEIKRRGAS
ncbi:hypothetical protein BJF87_21255 [Gordonia sp. CNJ-863]|uniref:hypothetical protein n=1 Tax=Gordonia sp. CNJ-863 TaxID=1904963 RepID=UPI00095A7BD1|nr:hypothetical protein [Gordonia sp. CNJ-863]OLT47745.1 hypothetical protein BJF87_21255 [Gordonia sp. CNJ-863]